MRHPQRRNHKMPETKVIYTVAMSADDLRVIAAALQELPYKFAMPVLSRLDAQVQAIDKSREEAVKAPPPVAAEP